MENKKDICIERIKYLMTYKYSEILEEDKVHKILIKYILDDTEYCLLVNWCMNKWNIKKTAQLSGQTEFECENDINKAIEKTEPILWSYRNNPFINDMQRKVLISKKKWIGDIIIERFLDTDIMMMKVNDFIDVVSNK